MIRSIMIVEIAGRPAEHVKESLEKHVGGLRAFKDIKVNNVVVSEPKEIEGAKDSFTCFAEVDFEVESFGRLCDCVFDFMPSSIEVVDPGKINFTNFEATSLLNIISGRMHKYDEVARFAQFKMGQMASLMQKIQKGEVKIKPTDKTEEKKVEKIEEKKEVVEGKVEEVKAVKKGKKKNSKE